MPDSPRLLIRKERHEEAMHVLACLQGNGATSDSPSVKAQYSIIKEVLDKVRLLLSRASNAGGRKPH